MNVVFVLTLLAMFGAVGCQLVAEERLDNPVWVKFDGDQCIYLERFNETMPKMDAIQLCKYNYDGRVVSARGAKKAAEEFVGIKLDVGLKLGWKSAYWRWSDGGYADDFLATLGNQLIDRENLSPKNNTVVEESLCIFTFKDDQKSPVSWNVRKCDGIHTEVKDIVCVRPLRKTCHKFQYPSECAWENKNLKEFACSQRIDEISNAPDNGMDDENNDTEICEPGRNHFRQNCNCESCEPTKWSEWTRCLSICGSKSNAMRRQRIIHSVRPKRIHCGEIEYNTTGCEVTKMKCVSQQQAYRRWDEESAEPTPTHWVSASTQTAATKKIQRIKQRSRAPLGRDVTQTSEDVKSAGFPNWGYVLIMLFVIGALVAAIGFAIFVKRRQQPERVQNVKKDDKATKSIHSSKNVQGSSLKSAKELSNKSVKGSSKRISSAPIVQSGNSTKSMKTAKDVKSEKEFISGASIASDRASSKTGFSS